jgi:hypothetical protein
MFQHSCCRHSQLQRNQILTCGAACVFDNDKLSPYCVWGYINADLNVKREVCVPLPYPNCPYTEEHQGLQSPSASLDCACTWRILAPTRGLQRGPCSFMTEDLSVNSYLLYLEVPQWLDKLGDDPMHCTDCFGISWCIENHKCHTGYACKQPIYM